MCASLEGQLHIYSFPAFVSTFIRLYLCVYRVRVCLLYQDLVSIFSIFYLDSQKRSWEIWVRWSCIGVEWSKRVWAGSDYECIQCMCMSSDMKEL